MSVRAAVADRAEQIKWWDALDALTDRRSDVNLMLWMARCQHPDAQWLCALFPAGVGVTRERFVQVMMEQEEDPRALHLVWSVEDHQAAELLQRSAELGYAPAQAALSEKTSLEEAFLWAQRAAAQGNRSGFYELAQCFFFGWGCAKDRGKAIKLYREAAELGHGDAQIYYGQLVFDGLDWQRYLWWGRASAKGKEHRSFCAAVQKLLVRFENGELDRVLHTVAPVIRSHLDVAAQSVFGSRFELRQIDDFQRVVKLHDAMMGRARRAIDCWSIVGLRCRVVKDIRVMISKMAWEEPWRWGAKEDGERRGRGDDAFAALGRLPTLPRQ